MNSKSNVANKSGDSVILITDFECIKQEEQEKEEQ